MYRLEIQRKGADTWEKLNDSRDVFSLAERARHLTRLWKMRPQDGCAAARVLADSGALVTIYNVATLRKLTRPRQYRQRLAKPEPQLV